MYCWCIVSMFFSISPSFMLQWFVAKFNGVFVKSVKMKWVGSQWSEIPCICDKHQNMILKQSETSCFWRPGILNNQKWFYETIERKRNNNLKNKFTFFFSLLFFLLWRVLFSILLPRFTCVYYILFQAFVCRLHLFIISFVCFSLLAFVYQLFIPVRNSSPNVRVYIYMI